MQKAAKGSKRSLSIGTVEQKVLVFPQKDGPDPLI